MKKSILTTILLFFAFSYCIAQNKGHVSFSIGPSFPSGDFGSKDANNASAGFATTGVVLDLSFAYKLGNNLGFTGMLRGQANSIDNNTFASELSRQIGGSWTVESKPWSLGGLMAGLYGSFPLSEKVAIDTRAMLGFLNAASPEINISLDGSGGSAWVKQSSVTASSLSYLIGGGFKFDVGDKTCLLLNIDYLHSKPEFKNVTTTSSNGGAPIQSTYSLKMESVNIGFGIGLRL